MKKKYTLEEHLRRVSKNHDTNHSLESVYDLQKRKLTRYLSSVVTTYPTYSTHDTWHSANIVSAIENILGKDRIKKLTGIDTFLILMCSYMHDIGMLYTEQEVRELWKTKEFQSFLADYQSDESTIGKAAKLLLDAEEKRKEEVTWPLDIKQAIIIVLMEYFRPQHGKRIQKLTEKTNQIGELLCVEDSFLPSRIIKVINKIAMAHTGSFEGMLDELVMVDTFAGEEFHPRLVAWLLRIGDLCDVDNDRFNKIGIATFGTLQDENLAHYFKHCSVETLYISSDRIQIIANIDRKLLEQECASQWMKEDAGDGESIRRRCMKVYQQTIREHVSWKSWMESEINSAKLNVNKIFPEQWNRKIPEIEYRILLNGKEISSGNQNLRFSFSQEKAYSLIENISIYQNEGLIFLRELIQNAIDASKIQIWREIKGQIPDYPYEISPFQVERMFPGIFEKYSIDISLQYDAETDRVDFEIKDAGIGISVQEFQDHILKTGNSWGKREKYKKEFENMPEWLKPTGSFGIGLHTVFTVTDEMKIYTKSDQEEQTNEILLYSGKKSGYAFCQKAEQERARGTTVSFTFHLNEAQKAQCFTESKEDSYLRESGTEYEQIVMEHIREYCSTPMVPIYFNEKFIIVQALVSSEAFGVLQEVNGTSVWGDTDIQRRFEYCFGEGCKQIIIYDKKTRYLVRIKIVLWTEKNSSLFFYGIQKNSQVVSFMGMRVEDPIEIQEGGRGADYIDLLAGEGKEVIDAARMRLTYEAKIKIQMALEEMIVFAKQCYFSLMKTQRRDEEVQQYRKEIRFLAENYYTGEITASGIWEKMVIQKRKFFPKMVYAKGDKGRKWICLLCLPIVDEIIKLDIRNLKEEKSEEKMFIKAFGLLDYVLEKWRADCEKMDEYFSGSYSESGVVKVLEHYCCIWGQIIIQYVIGSQWIDSPDGKWGTRIKEQFNRACPNICKWNEAGRIIDRVIHMIYQYREEKGKSYTSWSALEEILSPGAAVALEDREYKDLYADHRMMALEIVQPYGWLPMDIPQSSTIGRLEKEVWDLYIKNSIYGAFRYDMISPDAAEKILDEKYVILKERESMLTYDCIPFLKKYGITELQFEDGRFNVKVEAPKTEGNGIRATKTEKDELYRRFWKLISNPYFKGQFVKILAFEEYREISDFCTEYNVWFEITCRYPYVPLWDYIDNIREFVSECDEKEWGQGVCVQEIIDRGLDRKVIDHLWKTKTDGSAKDRERIEALYRKFLSELFAVRDEN